MECLKNKSKMNNRDIFRQCIFASLKESYWSYYQCCVLIVLISRLPFTLFFFFFFQKGGGGPAPPPPQPLPLRGPWTGKKKIKEHQIQKKKYKTQAYQSRCSSWKPSRKARIAWDFSTLFTHQQGKKRKWRHVKLDFRWLWQAAHF